MYLPIMEGDPIERVMLIETEVTELLDGPYQSVHHARRIGRLRADLESFVMGEEITLSFTPYEHGSAYMGLLDPKGQATWDIRSRDPEPGLRVFGRFACPDVFVALTWSPRSKEVGWSRKPALEDIPLMWRIQILDCDQKWNSILPGLVPVSGDEVERYVTANVSVV